MDIAVIPTTSLEVKDQWLNFNLNHGVNVEGGQFAHNYNANAYAQSLFFSGDKDGKPTGNGMHSIGMNPGMRPIPQEALEKMLSAEMADGSTVKEYLIASLNALAAEV